MGREKESSSRQLILGYVWPDWPCLAVGSCALLLSAFSNAYAPRAMGRVIDALSRARDKSTRRGEVRRELVATAVVFGIGAVASGLRVRMFATVLERSVSRLRRDLYRAALCRSSAFFDGAGEEATALATTLERDARCACSTLTEQAQNAVRYASSACNGAVSLLRLNGQLALELVSCVPVAALLLRGAGKAVSKAGAKASRSEASCCERARDCLSRMRFVRSCAAEGVEWMRYGSLCDDAARLAALHGGARGAFHGLLDAVAKTAVLGVVARGGSLVESGAMTAGDLLSFGLYAGYFALGLAGLAKFAASELAAGNRAAARCVAILRSTEPVDVCAAALLDGPSSHAIRRSSLGDPNIAVVQLRDVWLTYKGKPEPALRGASLTVHRGEIHGIVGPSGSGKTSIFGVVLALYDPDRGSVSVCGLDLASATPAQLADLRGSRVATADQSASAALFAGTIAQTVAYPDRESPDLDLALKLAAIDDYAAAVGHDSQLGDRGAALSGGQRARLAVARAVAKRHAEVLLLDEPTSALDKVSEEKLLDAVFADARRRGVTVLVIAHSTAAMARCDVISVLDDGQVVETGPYDKLRRNLNSRLCKLVAAAPTPPAL